MPQNRRIDWAKGLGLTNFTYPNRIIDFVAVGGNNGGFIPNDQLMSAILNEIHPDTGAIIYFPEGEYLFNETIGLKSNIVLKGVSAGVTYLNFNLGGSGNLIEIKGLQTTIESEFTTGAAKGDSSILLVNAGLFQIGDFIQIIDNDSLKVTSDWAVGSTGQIARIKSISANTITLVNVLRRKYLIEDAPKVVLLDPIKNVGIEQLTINRTDTTAG
ncbi:MAG: glycosyl hydrolase family 28-related protein, partial [Ignavibacteria bacterium]|nr:glycosyl hydrolase family 28-related protein [Ignavibacteria bacterium]